MRVQWAGEYETVGVLVTDWQAHVLDDCSSHLVVHRSGFGIADPTMDTTTTREDPHDVLDVEVLLQDHVDQLGGQARESPTTLTNLGTLAALSDVIVSIHIDIKDHFLFLWDERLFVSLEMARWRHIINCAKINFVRNSAHQCGLEFFRCFETEITTINVVSKSESEFTIVEIIGGDLFVVD